LIDTHNIYATCKEEQIAGYSCYSFVIDGCTHYVFGETQEQAFDYLADLIKEYTKNNNEHQRNQTKPKQSKNYQGWQV